MKNSASFFSNRECEYFPCHKVDNDEDFNCLFCYCPLYALGRKCRGNYSYTENGIKDCSKCLIPHRPDTADYIMKRFMEIVEAVKTIENAAGSQDKQDSKEDK